MSKINGKEIEKLEDGEFIDYGKTYIINKINEILDALDKKEINYERDYSHGHCFNQKKDAACGPASYLHRTCCICEIKNPNIK